MKKSIVSKDVLRVCIAAFLFFLVSLAIVTIVLASTNISSVTANHFAWNDVIGWANFYNTNTVIVTSPNLQGYASSSAGDISLDCHTTRNGDICSGQNGTYQVVNDGVGNLSGWAWNDTYGWISFCGTTGTGTSDCPHAGTNYRVLVDADNGTFSQWAWNDAAGWVSVNCVDTPSCSSSYKVVTSWIATSTFGSLDSTTYDTGVSGGAQINSFVWHGTQPAGTAVRFQFAASNASGGPWNFAGPDGTANTYYDIGPDLSKSVGYTFYNNQRYFRYRATLVSNQAQTVSPQVDDVIVNWSP